MPPQVENGLFPASDFRAGGKPDPLGPSNENRSPVLQAWSWVAVRLAGWLRAAGQKMPWTPLNPTIIRARGGLAATCNGVPKPGHAQTKVGPTGPGWWQGPWQPSLSLGVERRMAEGPVACHSGPQRPSGIRLGQPVANPDWAPAVIEQNGFGPFGSKHSVKAGSAVL